jgi:hypothetical protein
MTVEEVKTVFDWIVVILAGLTFISIAIVLVTGNIINKRQAAQLREFDQGLTSAKIDLGKQQERAARVETDLAIQKERTAKAEKAASDAKLALEKFREPRTLSPEQQDKLLVACKPFAGQYFAFAVFPDPEPLALLRILDSLLKSAGWKRVPSQIDRVGGVKVDAAGESAATIFDSGVDAYIAPDDTASVAAQHAFCAALVSAGISCENHRTPQLAGKMPMAITISIGKKP